MEEANKIGTIRIADSVVASIAAIAALETEGVYRLEGGITKDNVSKAGKKKLMSAVSAEVEDRKVVISVDMELAYGSGIKKVCAEVQSKIKQAIENMTGLSVTCVDTHVTGVVVE